MARYFFHLHDADGVCVDDSGLERSSRETARQEAIRAARGLIAAEVGVGCFKLTSRIEVTDERGEHVLTLPFADAIEEWDVPTGR